MGKRARKNLSENSNRFLLLLGLLVSLFFWVPHIDSFNVSKQSLLVVGTASALVFALYNRGFRKFKNNDPILWISIFFVGYLLVSLFLAPNWQLALWGSLGRSNGVLTYLSLLGVFFSLAYSRTLLSVKNLLVTLTLLGALQSLYNLMQLVGIDPIDWNNPYGLVIGTLGNADFTIALTGICWIATCWLFITAGRGYKKLFLASLLGIELFIVFNSQVRQGLVLIVFGLACITLIISRRRSRKFVGALILIFSGAGFTTLLGALQIGPLKGIIYKESITFRGDYWRAAISMFQDQPISGVGFAHYGQAFTLHRDSLQANRRGPAIVSDQAHSIPLEFLATGGLILLLVYTIFILAILNEARRAIKSKGLAASGDILIILSLLLAYLLQSLISIDQIGLAIWGWILMGYLVAVSRQDGVERVSSYQKKKNVIPAIIAAVMSLGLISFPWQADSKLKAALSIQGNEANKRIERLKILQDISSPILPSHYLAEASAILLSNGQLEGIEFAKRALEINPSDVRALKYLVIAGKETQNQQLIDQYGPILKKLDPFTVLLEK